MSIYSFGFCADNSFCSRARQPSSSELGKRSANLNLLNDSHQRGCGNQSEFSKDPDQRNYIGSNHKIEAFGYQPQHDIQSGITELIKGFAVLNPHKYSNV